MTKRETTPAVDPQNTVSALVRVGAPAAMLFRSWLVSVVSRFDNRLFLLAIIMGFAEERGVPELVAVAVAVTLALVPDCAGGIGVELVFPTTPWWAAMVATVPSSVADGVSCTVLFMKMDECSLDSCLCPE